MKFAEFEAVMSPARMARYVAASAGNTKAAMSLYRKNLKLSGELLTLISCFEVALRNKIDGVYTIQHGPDWLRNAGRPGGFFDTTATKHTREIARRADSSLGIVYTHNKLIAEMDFGFWRYLFAQPQFFAGGQVLLRVFPAKPRSTPAIQYNQSFVFNELARINNLRNRIAHHEPVCFTSAGGQVKDTTYARQTYGLILQLFQWMNINEAALLYGVDHVPAICNEIDAM